MKSNSRRAALLAVAVTAACSPAAPVAPPAAPPHPAAAEMRPAELEPVAPRPLPEEPLAARPGRDAGLESAPWNADDAEAALPPDPATVLASLPPDSPPQRVASLRLTDEGRRRLAAGDADGALDRIETAVRIDPSNPHGYYWLAQVHYAGGQLDQALAFADKSVSLFGTADPVWLAQGYTFRAVILERAGRFREARESYARAIRIQPGNVPARAGLARLGDPGGLP